MPRHFGRIIIAYRGIGTRNLSLSVESAQFTAWTNNGKHAITEPQSINEDKS